MGHLDVDNIKWLEDWLLGFQGSIICTSHFTPFLDMMRTHIIDFQDRKLKTFKGTEKGKCLTHFVEKYPEKGLFRALQRPNEVHLPLARPPGGREVPNQDHLEDEQCHLHVPDQGEADDHGY